MKTYLNVQLWQEDGDQEIELLTTWLRSGSPSNPNGDWTNGFREGE